MDMMENWCHFRSLLSRLNKQSVVPFINTAITHNIEPQYIAAAFEKQFYYQWIDYIISKTPVLSTFNRISQDKAIHTFVEKDTEQFEINKAKIRAELSSMRPSIDMIAPGSALATLLREGEKKRKQKSIRSLLSETGELVQRIKPCFLMSPLSVSTFLAAGAVHFDVVVFDEASQIFPQDAIGAIYRANQLIVVGDSKQMPPSNFFNATIEAEDNDEETGDVTDFESILDWCSTSMQQLRLRWHYRSRYEQLITFSNKNFYDNDLITFPSSKADKPGVGVDYFHVDGVFDRKSHTNRKEAEYVVDLIYQNIEKYPNRSLGVVAFSVAQQDLIDKLLSKRRQSTPEKEFFFKSSEKEPFFIKNLETVQGDERDTIIFSVAYGIDAQGRLLHNFGPLNRAGGERRLNVAVTRAKCNVQLVSSMHYTDIDLKRTSAEGAKLLREYLDFAENGNIALERAIQVSAFEQFDSDFELEVCEFLRANGFSVDTQVGCSGFRIDLGLKIPDSSDYVLAIECDGATYHSSKNARDRDRLRQEILERMGWKFYRIWSTDWFRNQAVEKQCLLEAANNALQFSSSVVTPQQEPKDEVESFEEVAATQHFEFPPYKAADINKLSRQFLPRDFKGFVKAILEVEAPLSEELLLKRIVGLFGREKVTSVVQRSFEQQMYGYQRYDIVRRNGFLYLANAEQPSFRGVGDIARDIKQIAPEELAAGMLEILKQNMTADKNGLYRTLAQQCGINRVGKAINEQFDSVLRLLSDDVYIDGEQVMLK
ncbi:MAG: AAA domain-containing protein [Lachnospiraceae bacterium]|nr:AAA domain-containing protein [Lachnospiraceae bacterium]